MRTMPSTVGSAPEKDPRKVFIGGKWAVGTPLRDGMPFRGDSNTHIHTQTIETPRSRAHIKAEISRLAGK